jgi:formimidoylglutamate deiminase
MNRMFAERALLATGWKSKVLLEWDGNGILTAVKDGAERVDRVPVAKGVVLPGMPNLHSHAFQRAMAGLTEYRSHPSDSFWSWRTLMYSFAQKVSPQALKAIAVQVYIEMLKAGYTSVCEFHYVHHAAGGKAYANPCEMAECLVAAAAEAGIGLTLLPVMYQYSGFGARPFHAGQARFINSPEWMMDLLERMQRSHPQHAGLRYGVAPHSLRAVSPAALRELLAALNRWDSRAPVHIHIAEQTQEVEDCIASFGARPVEWLLANANVDQRWCLVHATHMTESETGALARSGAVAGICPTTEANLGDGVFNGVAYAAANGAWGIGSDSNVSTSVAEELRMYEYSQRLLHRQRNMLVAGSGGSVAAYLYGKAVRGGAAVTGRAVAGLEAGQRADLLVLDDTHPDLLGRQDDALLDSFVFCSHGQTPVRDVMSGGKWVIQDRRHRHQEASAAAYGTAVEGLLAG